MAEKRIYDPRGLVFRVRGIPKGLYLPQIRQTLNCLLVPGLAVDMVHIRSVCTSLQSSSACRMQEALVQFDMDDLPPLLSRCDEEIIEVQMSSNFKVQIDSHFGGWTVLHEPEHGNIHMCLMFITGLSGHAFHSWRQQSSSYMWPQDYIAKEYPSLLSLSYGYHISLQKPSIATYKEKAQILMHDIGQQLDWLVRHPFSIAAHSLGGLVVKQCMVNMSRAQQSFNHFFVATRVIVFFGVPHKGMDNADLIKVIEGRENEQGIRELGHNSPGLLELDEAFKKVCQQYNIRVISVFETCMTKSIEAIAGSVKKSGDPVWRVKPQSAIHDLSATSHQIPIDKDHSLLTRFSSTDKELGTIMKMVTNAAAEFRESWRYNSMPIRRRPCEGRTAELDQIRRLLNISGSLNDRLNEKQVDIVVICGMNAIGKTFLAEHFYECHEDLYTWKCTVCAATTETFLASLLLNSEYRRFHSQYKQKESSGLGKLVGPLLAFLDERSTKPWLLLLDDVPSDFRSYINDLIEQLRGLRGGHVIVTTRRVNSFAEDQPLKLGPLSRDASRRVLLDALADRVSQSNEGAVEGLLEMLGGHPLALRVMGAYLSSINTPWDNAYQEISQRLAHTRGMDRIGPLEIDEKIAEAFSQTWMMVLNSVCAITPCAEEMLKLWGCFERVGFSYDLLQHYEATGGPSTALCQVVNDHDSYFSFPDVLRILYDFALVTYSATGVYDLHQLPHAACRRLALMDDRIAWQALQCVGAAVPLFDHPEFWTKGASFLPHALAAWTLHKGFLEEPSMPDSQSEAQASSFQGLARLFRSQGRLNEAHQVNEYVGKILQRLPEQRGVLLRHALTRERARVAMAQEEPQRAIELFADALEGLGQYLGYDSAQALAAAMELALSYEEAGLFDCAKAMLQAIQKDCADKPELSDIKYKSSANLVGLTWDLRGLDAAEEVYNSSKDLLALAKEKFPDDTLKIATEACSLAAVCCATERLEEAKQLYECYLPELDRLMPDHRDVCITRAAYGLLHTKMGDDRRAEDIFLQVLAALERHARRKNDAQWATVKEALGDLYWRRGERDAAGHMYQEAEPVLSAGDTEWLQKKLDQASPEAQVEVSLASSGDRE